MQVRSLGREDPLEKEMRTHSSLLAWRTPWTEEPGGLQSMPPALQQATIDPHFTRDSWTPTGKSPVGVYTLNVIHYH